MDELHHTSFQLCDSFEGSADQRAGMGWRLALGWHTASSTPEAQSAQAGAALGAGWTGA